MRERRIEELIGLSTPDPPAPEPRPAPFDDARAKRLVEALWEAEGEQEVSRARRRVVRLGEPVVRHLEAVVRSGPFEDAARAMSVIAEIRPRGSSVAREAFRRTLSTRPSASVTALRRAAVEGDTGASLEVGFARTVAKDALAWLSLLRAEGWGVRNAWNGCRWGNTGSAECQWASATLDGVRASRELLERCAPADRPLELLRSGIDSRVDVPNACSMLDGARVAAVRYLLELQWERHRRLALPVIHAEGMRCQVTVSSDFGQVKLLPWSSPGGPRLRLSHDRLEPGDVGRESRWAKELVVTATINTGASMISVRLGQVGGVWRVAHADQDWVQFCL